MFFPVFGEDNRKDSSSFKKPFPSGLSREEKGFSRHGNYVK
jgi:hypothetical protein